MLHVAAFVEGLDGNRARGQVEQLRDGLLAAHGDHPGRRDFPEAVVAQLQRQLFAMDGLVVQMHRLGPGVQHQPKRFQLFGTQGSQGEPQLRRRFNMSAV
ncbi:hypothetical protein D3C81_1528110 [compost metagenome]